MNRYPIWKYVIIVIMLLLGTIYSLPNLYGEAPAVQVSPGKATVKLDNASLSKVESLLQAEGLQASMIQMEGHSIKARFDDTTAQLKARDVLEKAFNPNPAEPNYVVALNLLPRTPAWLQALHANPMYLGLDLRGGVHFLLQVDMAGALTKKADVYASDLRMALRDKNIRHGGITRNGQSIEIRVRDAATTSPWAMMSPTRTRGR